MDLFSIEGEKGVVQIGKHVLNVVYYFTEDDTIHCKVIGDYGSFYGGYTFFTHYKSLIIN